MGAGFCGGSVALGGDQVVGTGGQAQAGREAELRAARARLEDERRRIQEEISGYPAPVAGCDEQFNYLLERRAQVRRELARVVEAEERLRRGSKGAERCGS